MAKVYVASSWRNPYQPEVVARLREAGHEVYDFRNPQENPGGFHWADVDARWQEWTVREYIDHLDHPVAEKGFQADFRAMEWADACVLVLPCGRSAHTEAGWFAGKGIKTLVYIPEKQEPELMYRLFDTVVDSIDGILQHLPAAMLDTGTSDEAVWRAYQDICDGMPGFQALLLNNLTEEYYNEHIDRVIKNHLT